jgi:ribosome-binding protein aMBF1 (putative translation factor)
MENCVRCNVSSDKVQLFDAIYNGKMDYICERCSLIENIPIIKKPDISVLNDRPSNLSVYDRLKKLSGIKDSHSVKTKLKEDRLKAIEDNPRLELPLKEQLNLMHNFHWLIMKNRRKKGMSFKQLGEAISESEIALEMLEKGKISSNSEQIIRKLEQFFQINLRNITETEEFLNRKSKSVRTKPILLDENGNELDSIPENLNENSQSDDLNPNLIFERKLKDPEKTNLKDFDKRFILGKPWRRESNEPKNISVGLDKEEISRLSEKENFDLGEVDFSRLTIKDLKEIHKRKVVVTKQEKIDEQRMIEERERLIEARKEEFRSQKERQSKDIDSVLAGKEFLTKK